VESNVYSQKTAEDLKVATVCLLIACSITAFLLYWHGDKGLSLLDEGFLWYGAQRTLLGEVPIRDFHAYDPGRYYWSAAFLSLLGDNGIYAVRVALAAFQTLGLFIALLVIQRSGDKPRKTDLAFVVIAAITLAAWTYQWYRLFDISLAMMLVGLLTYWISHPTAKRYLIAGIGVGLIAVFGRNHGLYGAVASLGVIAWLNIHKSPASPGLIKGIVLWGTGVLIGYAPLLLMLLWIPDFAKAFWKSILFLFEYKATNLPLPIPWPWKFLSAPTAIMGQQAVRGVLTGIFFLGTLVFGALSLVWVFSGRLQSRRVPAGLVAAAVLSLPYAHYAFSRADHDHLMIGIMPLLIGALVILVSLPARLKWPLAAGLCAATVWLTYPGFLLGWNCRVNRCEEIEIAGRQHEVDVYTAMNVSVLRQLADKFAPNQRPFIAEPFWPGAYALLERKSPLYDIYALFPRSDTFQMQEIASIQQSNPGFAIILEGAIDGREDLRFVNTHPLTHQYIVDHFKPAELGSIGAVNPQFATIYQAKDAPK
jgi:hypothetical protein